MVHPLVNCGGDLWFTHSLNKNRDLTRDLTLWRFGFRVRYKVRDHVGHGGTAIFHNVFQTDLHSAVLESTHDCGH